MKNSIHCDQKKRQRGVADTVDSLSRLGNEKLVTQRGWPGEAGSASFARDQVLAAMPWTGRKRYRCEVEKKSVN
jgi:hypothetical protein